MNDDSTPWDNATESSTALPGEVSPQDGYVLLLALLSIFIGGTLVLLSGILIICRRCCEADRRHSRASDDPEKTTTTYLDDSQPAQDITIKVEDPECMSASSYRDAESERFLSSSSSSARRVSFNEAALYEQGKKTQEKGRRYTLTEGDFHHLKNARLTHLHLPPPALKIVTIHECESSENSLAMTPRRPPPKPGLAIFQPPGGAVPQPGHAVCPSSALPGDTYNSTAGGSPASSSDSGEGPSFSAAPRSGKGPIAGSGSPGDAPPAPTQGPVLQFFTRLRRHASLDGASPYFRIKKWKLESTQRASSLDTRGSPKRRQFQRQRAASESMDQEDRDPHQTDIIQYIAHTDDVAFHPAGGPFLPSPSSPPPSLGRYFSVDRGDGDGGGGPVHGEGPIFRGRRVRVGSARWGLHSSDGDRPRRDPAAPFPQVRAGRGQSRRGGGPGASQRRSRHLEPPRLAGAVRGVRAKQRPGLGAQRRSGQRLVGRRGPLPLLIPGRGRRPRREALGPAQSGGVGARYPQAAADGQRLRLHRGSGPGG
uniref:CACN subunit beta associated regulatory protein n=1 Tax=Coturnix japonica TaxID=93934 RepID=A0A8C2TH83_COTJA